MPRRSSQKTSRERFSPDGSYELGDFRLDGSWDPESSRPEDRNAIRHLYWFIDMLCTKRRRDHETVPARFAERIMASSFGAAFPNASTGAWHITGHWIEARCSTSSEVAIRQAGYSAAATPDATLPYVSREEGMAAVRGLLAR